MGMKDKGGRAFGSGNEFMGSGVKPRHNPKGLPPKSKARALTHRASRCVNISVPDQGGLEPLVNDPGMDRANHLMGW